MEEEGSREERNRNNNNEIEPGRDLEGAADGEERSREDLDAIHYLRQLPRQGHLPNRLHSGGQPLASPISRKPGSEFVGLRRVGE